MRITASSQYQAVRSIALALPGVIERRSHGEPCFFVERRPVCYFHDDHNRDGRVSLWCPAPTGVPDDVVAAEPERFFRPQASSNGVFATWLGVYLDVPSVPVDWTEVSAIIEDAFRLVAPRRLIASLDGQ